MTEFSNYSQLKLQYKEKIITDAQYMSKLEELCDALISRLNPEDNKAKIITIILNPDNTDMRRTEIKQLAMESVLNKVS